MNCENVRDKLIDLAYGELAPPAASAITDHLAGCPQCRAELDKLRLARRALRRRRANEPAAPVVESDRFSETGDEKRVHPLRRWLAGAAAAAAILAAAIGVWLLLEKTTEPVKAAGPVEITRLNVSLTIMSEPENWPNYYQPRAEQGKAVQMRSQAAQFQRPSYIRGWQGLALVRDQRLVKNLKKGTTEVRFTDVPSGILPDTVRLRSLDRPGKLNILEQNYQYDLASTWAILHKYVDETITVAFQDAPAVSGRLLSFDGGTLVLQPAGEGPRSVTRDEVLAIRFAKLPDGLLSKPTLMWKLRNTAEDRQQFEVAYLTEGLKWRADYVLKLEVAQGRASRKRKGAGGLQLPEIVDTASLVGYATVTNNSGVTYKDAQLKLMAGDVNLIRPPAMLMYDWAVGGAVTEPGGGAGGFQEKSFFEYHLYTLGRPTTLRNAETKQIQLVSGSGIKLTRGYVYDPTVNSTAARVVSEFKNSEENGLGKPLPKGVIRLYAPDPEGIDTYVAQTSIDHTPKNEKIRLPWGYAFDIACSYKQTAYRRSGDDRYRKFRYDVRNHKDYDVTVTVIVRLPKSTYKANCLRAGKDYPWHIREVGIIEVELPVKANSAESIEFSYRHNNSSGGGLKSQWDKGRE